jgi:hypothetical protein
MINQTILWPGQLKSYDTFSPALVLSLFKPKVNDCVPKMG